MSSNCDVKSGLRLIVSSNINDVCSDFVLDIVNFLYFDGDIPRTTSCVVYISQLIRSARVYRYLDDFNAGDKGLIAKLLQQWYRLHTLRKDHLFILS